MIILLNLLTKLYVYCVCIAVRWLYVDKHMAKVERCKVKKMSKWKKYHTQLHNILCVKVVNEYIHWSMEGKIYFGKLDDFESNKRDDEEISSVEYKNEILFCNLVMQFQVNKIYWQRWRDNGIKLCVTTFLHLALWTSQLNFGMNVVLRSDILCIHMLAYIVWGFRHVIMTALLSVCENPFVSISSGCRWDCTQKFQSRFTLSKTEYVIKLFKITWLRFKNLYIFSLFLVEKDPYPVHALPTCDYALDVCRKENKCIQLYRNFQQHCKQSDEVCMMEDG